MENISINHENCKCPFCDFISENIESIQIHAEVIHEFRFLQQTAVIS